ncbi:unnamed protein product [Prorocentrum cordatum]|uniref:Uncharacterized protein n=1 Tax=Prorocentrum cordatum TaxID=2364126 RepID=A0ABN9SUB0_9DINO|nr:unnamed protein product [Polarella glacialis]
MATFCVSLVDVSHMIARAHEQLSEVFMLKDVSVNACFAVFWKFPLGVLLSVAAWEISGFQSPLLNGVYRRLELNGSAAAAVVYESGTGCVLYREGASWAINGWTDGSRSGPPRVVASQLSACEFSTQVLWRELQAGGEWPLRQVEVRDAGAAEAAVAPQRPPPAASRLLSQSRSPPRRLDAAAAQRGGAAGGPAGSAPKDDPGMLT